MLFWRGEKLHVKKTVGICYIHFLFSNLAREKKISIKESIERSKKEASSPVGLILALEKLSLKSLETDKSKD